MNGVRGEGRGAARQGPGVSLESQIARLLMSAACLVIAAVAVNSLSSGTTPTVQPSALVEVRPPDHPPAPYAALAPRIVAPTRQPGKPSRPLPASCSEEVVRGMTRTQRAAQLFLVGVGLDNVSGGADLVAGTPVGGVFLRGRSAAGQDLAPAIGNLQRTARGRGVLPLHIAADEEGGLVQSIAGPGIPPWPSARAQSTWALDELSTRSKMWASSLKALGITLDLGPVADVVSIAHRRDNPPIGALGREYGATPAAAAQRVGVITAALQQAGVGATAKHFPGLGRVLANTDTSTRARDADATTADGNLAPFAAATRVGATAIMMSSARYPNLDGAAPAVWSRPIIGTLLRRQLGFRGLVLSDDLSNARALTATPAGVRAVRFLEAGGDMLLIVDAADLRPMLAAVASKAAASAEFTARIDDAARQVVESKIKLGLISCRP